MSKRDGSNEGGDEDQIPQPPPQKKARGSTESSSRRSLDQNLIILHPAGSDRRVTRSTIRNIREGPSTSEPANDEEMEENFATEEHAQESAASFGMGGDTAPQPMQPVAMEIEAIEAILTQDLQVTPGDTVTPEIQQPGIEQNGMEAPAPNMIGSVDEAVGVQAAPPAVEEQLALPQEMFAHFVGPKGDYV